jgi:hypothetical protein
MSETTISNPANQNKKKWGEIPNFVSEIDKFGSQLTHNVAGVGRFWELGKKNEILGNADGLVISKRENRLAFLKPLEKLGNPTTWDKWAQLKHVVENHKNLNDTQIIRIITAYLDKIKVEDSKKREILNDLENIKLAVEAAESRDMITQIGHNIYKDSVSKKRDLLNLSASVVGFATGGTSEIIRNTVFGIGSLNVARNIGQEAMEVRITEIMHTIDFEILRYEIATKQDLNKTDCQVLNGFLRRAVIHCVNSKQRKEIVQTLSFVKDKSDNFSEIAEENFTVDGLPEMSNLYNAVYKLEEMMNTSGDKKTEAAVGQASGTLKVIAGGVMPLLKSIGNLGKNFGNKFIKDPNRFKITEQSEIDKKKAELFRSAAIGFLVRARLPAEIAVKFSSFGEIQQTWENTVGKFIPNFGDSGVQVPQNVPKSAPSIVEKIKESGVKLGNNQVPPRR